MRDGLLGVERDYGGDGMTDREKVLQALEHCDLCSDMPKCPGCAYLRESDCMEHMKRDIIALLKAQDPVMVEERADTDTINCPKCGQQFARVGHDKSIYLDTDEEPNYCPKCGQAVKWE